MRNLAVKALLVEFLFVLAVLLASCGGGGDVGAGGGGGAAAGTWDALVWDQGNWR